MKPGFMAWFVEVAAVAAAENWVISLEDKPWEEWFEEGLTPKQAFDRFFA